MRSVPVPVPVPVPGPVPILSLPTESFDQFLVHVYGLIEIGCRKSGIGRFDYGLTKYGFVVDVRGLEDSYGLIHTPATPITYVFMN